MVQRFISLLFNILLGCGSGFYKAMIEHFSNLWFNLDKFMVQLKHQMLKKGFFILLWQCFWPHVW